MATNTFNSIHHHTTYLHRHSHRRNSIDYTSPTTTTSSNTNTKFLIKQPLITTTTTTTFAATYSTPTTTPTQDDISFDELKHHLSTKNFRQADEETRRLLIALAGEQAVKRGYVFFSEVQFISQQDLKAIDELWRQYSDGRFGYSVQKKIWKKVNMDFTSFFIKVGWMKKLESSEVEQYNYRAFPDEFMWEMNGGDGENVDSSNVVVVPEGHLPLTNALRGTQLLGCILSHPAFDGDDDEDDDDVKKGDDQSDNSSSSVIKKSLSKATLFKPNYSF